MAKYQRKMDAKLNARIRACIQMRQNAARGNSKLASVIDKAFKMPGSRQMGKG